MVDLNREYKSNKMFSGVADRNVAVCCVVVCLCVNISFPLLVMKHSNVY